MARTLAVCTCNAVHSELRRFDLAVMTKPPQWESNVARALRCFALRGRSEVMERDTSFGHPEADMSCPRFLYRAFKSIVRAKGDVSQVHDYWGAYHVIVADLWLASRRRSFGMPGDIPQLGIRDPASKQEGVVSAGGEKSIDALCNIVDGLQQISSTTEKSYDDWEQARMFLGRDIVTKIFAEFPKALSKQHGWSQNKRLAAAARNLVLFWCNLERAYKAKLKKEQSRKEPDKKAIAEVYQKIEIDLDGTVDAVRHVLHDMSESTSVSIRNMCHDIESTFNLHEHELKGLKEDKEKSQPPDASPGF